LTKKNSAQRFSPRNPKSDFSQANIERLKWLIKNGMLHPSVEDTAKKVTAQKFIFPTDIITAIKKNSEAWKNYQNFSPAYKRIRVAYIDAARKHPEQFEKRLRNFIKKTEKNKQIGFGGINKYY
jgi:hypothetical protein